MNTSVIHKSATRPLERLRAKDLMSPNPVSIHRDVSISEALENLTDRGFGAAPVIDDAGRPIGVVSRTDILIHERECLRHSATCTCDNTDWDLFPNPSSSAVSALLAADAATVAEIMTPAIFTVALETTAREVIRRMLQLRVHHLFVVDAELALVGVISPLDVLRHLGEGE